MTDLAARDRGIARVLSIVLALNLLVAALKVAVGFSTGAVSLLADAVHSALDASSNVVGLIAMGIASRPPDESHPYGHRRFEALAALVIGLLIAAGLAEILRAVAVAVLEGHRAPEVTWLSAGAVAGTVVVNFLISAYERRRGRELRSDLLTADAGHTFTDGLAALVVLASFAGVALGFAWADLVAATVVCVFIARTAWDVLVTNLGVLADRVQLDRREVRRVVLGVAGVRGAHKIRSRGSPSHVQVDLHVHADPAMTLADAHALTHVVSDAIRGAFPQVQDVVIHTEPADGREAEATGASSGDGVPRR